MEATRAEEGTEKGMMRLRFPERPGEVLDAVQRCDEFLKNFGVTETSPACMMLFELMIRPFHPGRKCAAGHMLTVSVERLFGDSFEIDVQDSHEEKGCCARLKVCVSGSERQAPKPGNMVCNSAYGAFVEQYGTESQRQSACDNNPKIRGEQA